MRKSQPVRRLGVLAILTVIAVGGAACGSSSKNAASSSATTASAAASGQGTNASTAPPTTVALHGNSGSSFCDLARHDQAAFSSPNVATSTQAQLKSTYEHLGAALEQARNAAPSAIKGDFETLVTAFKPFLRALATGNYDFTKLGPAAFSSLGSAQVKTASAHITQYMRQVCGINSTPTT